MIHVLRSICLIFLIICSALSSPALADDQNKSNLMPPWKAYSLMKQKKPHTVIIDIRGTEAFAKRHIEGALHIPAFILPTKSFPKEWSLVLACTSLGMKDSIEAAEVLAKKGVQNLFVLEGGVQAWEGSGFPVVGHRKKEVRAIMSENLIWALEHGARVKMVDIRSKKEFDEAHVPESKHFPIETAEKVSAPLRKFLTAIKTKDRKEFEREWLSFSAEDRAVAKPYILTEVVVIARPGPDAGNLTRLLHLEGFNNVRFLYGGFEAIRGLIEKKGRHG